MTTDQRVARIVCYFAGDWKNVPMDKVSRFVKNELLDERDAALMKAREAIDESIDELLAPEDSR